MYNTVLIHLLFPTQLKRAYTLTLTLDTPSTRKLQINPSHCRQNHPDRGGFSEGGDNFLFRSFLGTEESPCTRGFCSRLLLLLLLPLAPAAVAPALAPRFTPPVPEDGLGSRSSRPRALLLTEDVERFFFRARLFSSVRSAARVPLAPCEDIVLAPPSWRGSAAAVAAPVPVPPPGL